MAMVKRGCRIMVETKKSLGIGEMVRLGLVLVCYAVASCAVLAIVNTFTSPKIQENQIKKANAAMKKVFAEADDFSLVDEIFSASNAAILLSDAHLVKKNGEVIGAVIQASGPTYDRAKIIVGLNTDFTVSGVQFLENTDSPGFGQKASDPNYVLPNNGKTFYDQFTGKNAENGFLMNESFDAISGATITSRAVGELVNEACAALKKVLLDN